MEVVNLTRNNSQDLLQKAVAVIANRGVVVCPTETLYALVADAANEAAVKKVYSIKGRDYLKPLPLIAGDVAMVEKFFEINAKERKVMEKFWPGPITMLLKVRDNEIIKNITQNVLASFANEVNSQTVKLAARVSSYKFVANLSLKLGWPITSTSANVSEQANCYDIKCILKQFKDNHVQPDLIINAGRLPKNLPSTIIDLSSKPYQILRQGTQYEVVVKFLKTLI